MSGLLLFEALFKAIGAESLHDVLSEPLIRNYLSLRQMSFPLTFTIMILYKLTNTIFVGIRGGIRETYVLYMKYIYLTVKCKNS